MKKLVRLFIIMILVSIVFSCEKDEDVLVPSKQVLVSDTTIEEEESIDTTDVIFLENESPVAKPQRHRFPYGTETIIDVTDFVSDEDGDIPFLISAEANHGSVVFEFRAIKSVNAHKFTHYIDDTYFINIIHYIPNDPNYIGRDTVRYVVSDSTGGTAKGEVWVHVGVDEQVATYEILSPYFSVQTSIKLASYNKMTLYEDGTFEQDGIGPMGLSAHNGVWEINVEGDIVFEKGVYFPEGQIHQVSQYEYCLNENECNFGYSFSTRSTVANPVLQLFNYTPLF